MNEEKLFLQYPYIPSAIWPIPHSVYMPIPDPPEKYEIVKDDEEKFVEPGTSHDPDFEAEDLNEPLRLNQAELSDHIGDLD